MFSPRFFRFTLKGYQPYQRFEDIILKLLPNITKEEINTNARDLFTHFPTMTDREFSFLSNNTKENSSRILNELLVDGSVEKYESKNGVMWKYKIA